MEWVGKDTFRGLISGDNIESVNAISGKRLLIKLAIIIMSSYSMEISPISNLY